MQGLKRKHEAEIALLEKKLQRSSALANSLETKHGKAAAQGVEACKELTHSEETLAATKSISKKRRVDSHNAKATAEKARGMQKKLKERLSEKMEVIEGLTDEVGSLRDDLVTAGRTISHLQQQLDDASQPQRTLVRTKEKGRPYSLDFDGKVH